MSDDASGEIIALLLHRWRTVLVCCSLGAAVGVVYAFAAPKWYEATLRVVQSQRSQESAAMSLASKLPIAIDNISTDIQRINAVLESNSVSDEVIDKFDLEKRYGADHRELAREALWGHCSTNVDRKSGVLALTCEDKDPQMAMAIASYFGEVGNKVFRRVSVSSAREERVFLETQVEKARKDVEDSSQHLREFQEKHKIVDLPEQSKAVISAMASLQGELISKQLELSYLNGFSARTESSVVQLQQQVSILQSKLDQLEATQQLASSVTVGSGSAAAAGSGAAAKPGGKEFFPPAMAVPELRFELEQLLREQKIRETVFGLMTQRYEMARIDEARDTSTFQILDAPTLPTYASRPHRRKVAFVGLIGGGALAFVWIVAPFWWRRRALLGKRE